MVIGEFLTGKVNDDIISDNSGTDEFASREFVG